MCKVGVSVWDGCCPDLTAPGSTVWKSLGLSGPLLYGGKMRPREQVARRGPQA